MGHEEARQEIIEQLESRIGLTLRGISTNSSADDDVKEAMAAFVLVRARALLLEEAEYEE